MSVGPWGGAVQVQVVWIYDTVVQQLKDHPERKFVFAEMAFMRQCTCACAVGLLNA